MKKSIRTLLVSVFAISLVLMAGSSTALAADWANPWTVPLTGDLTSTAVPPVTLAGAVKTDSGLIVPFGFPMGERQFGGNALVVSGLSGGSANACFSFPTYRYGWRGGVYEWTGSKWMALPTSIGNPEGKEGAPATACAPIYGNGTFALIISYNEGDALNEVIHECANIEFIFPEFRYVDFEDSIDLFGGVIYPAIPVGSVVTYDIRNIQPAGALSGALNGTGVVIANILIEEDPYAGGYYSEVAFPGNNIIDYVDEYWPFDITFTVRLYFTGCYKDFDFPEDIMIFFGEGFFGEG